MSISSFNEFCYLSCSKLYDPNVPEEAQCYGYLKLKEMIVNNITPASLEEIKRWETSPTVEEMKSSPHIKYMVFLHPILRNYIIRNWDRIKTLKID